MLRFPSSKFRLLVIPVILLVTACSPQAGEPQSITTTTSGLLTGSAVPSANSENGSGNPSPPVGDITRTQEVTPNPGLQPTSITATPDVVEIDWREAPIVPEVSDHVLEIYRAGQLQGRNPKTFSVIGDCQSIPYVFLGPFGRSILSPSSAESFLWDALDYFKESFLHWSVTSRGGFTAASILSPLQADPYYCKPGETPLTCEYRLNNPAYAFVTLETWLDPNTIDRYESYLRQILDYVIGHGTIPILITKADSAEVFNGKYVINPAIVRVAHDYNIPVVNFWRSAQYLPNGGIDPAREGFHLSQAGYDVKNTLALRALYSVWQKVEQANQNGTPGSGNLTSTPIQQVTASSEPLPKVIAPVCRGGCVYFGTMTSHDGAVSAHGVYAYSYEDQVLSRLLGDGFDLQDVSEDGKRLLVNTGSKVYEISLVSGQSTLVSENLFSDGGQGAYWNSDDSAVIFIDRNNPIQTDAGDAFTLFPSVRDGERYFEVGTCTSKDYCQSEGTYLQEAGQSPLRLDTFTLPVFAPDGQWVAYLNPAAATKDNYYHISYLLLEEPDLGISSRRVIYFPEEGGFEIYPDVRDYAFSPDGNQLFIIYDVYSAYFERSMRIQTYLLNVNTRILYDYGRLDGASGSLRPRMAWSPQGDRVLFFLTDLSPENEYSLNVFQTVLNTGDRLLQVDQGIMTSEDYFYISNLYWR
jgi:hypothetical protein